MLFSLESANNDLVLIENALVVPPPVESRSRQQLSGVLTSGGEMVENSISWSNTREPVNGTPPLPDASAVEDLPGTWMFGGIAYGHFGHFIVESMSRIWALADIQDVLDGIIFTPKVTGRNVDGVLGVYKPMMEALGVAVPARSAQVPQRVERLYVPRQGFGMSDLTIGSPKFRGYIKTHAGRDIPARGHERIYISRSRLPPQRGGLIGEAVLEELLAAEGYEMYHPQHETQNDQIAQYKAARDIISVDCSPLHLVGYVGNSSQRVAILTRRSMDVARSMVDQIITFNGADAFEVNALLRDWVPAGANRAGRSSFGEIDLPRTYESLKAKGMIEAEKPWEPLTDEQRRADLERIEALHNMKFRPLNESSSSQPHPRPALSSPTIPTSS